MIRSVNQPVLNRTEGSADVAGVREAVRRAAVVGLALVCTSLMVSACAQAPKGSSTASGRAAERARAATAQTCRDFEFRSKELTEHLSIEKLRAKDPHVWEGLDNLHGAIGVALYDLQDPELSQHLTAELGLVYALEVDYHSVGGRRRMQTDLSKLRRVQLAVDNSCGAATTQVTTT
jgi:hypothetical protein